MKRVTFLLLSAVFVLLLSACGGTADTGSAQSTPTTAPAVASAPTDTPTTAPVEAVIKTASATVDGKSVTILTDAKGMTLYYFTPDTSTKTSCTAACAQNWPPLLFTGSGNPTASTSLPGELEVYANDNGNQVIYNDHPLYTFAGDTAAGQTTGQGKAGKWYVATPDLAKNK